MTSRLLHTRSLCGVLFTAASLLATGSVQSQTQPRPPDKTAYAYARDSAFALQVNRSHIAFTIPQKDLLAENVAFNPLDSSFYVGSTRHGKVVRRAKNGRISDFIPTGRDGLWMVVGMKVDPARRALWVNTSAQGNYVGLKSEDQGKAALFRYDLNGRLVKRYVPKEEGNHFFNDVVIVPGGTVYVTDMIGGAIYRIGAADSLELWAGKGRLTDPNGITASGDGRLLFVASNEGISMIDAASGSVDVLRPADGIDPLAIDGIYWHRGALIGIQAGRRNRVQRFTIDVAAKTIVAAEVLEANHPMFMNPTTGVIVGNDLYFIANAQFASFRRGALFPSSRLFETVVLRLPLN
jgi:sugar lactone lactonase YvrE